MNVEQSSGDSFPIVFSSRHFPQNKLRTMVLRSETSETGRLSTRGIGDGREMTATCSQGLEKFKK
ncbi:hypothetical protein ACRRTK_021961 [Alexandromys fortis]